MTGKPTYEELEQRVRELESSDSDCGKALEASLEREKRLRSLFDGIPVPLYLTGEDGRILEANQALAEMLGFTDTQSLLFQDSAQFLVQPEEQIKQRNILEQDGVLHGYEVEFRRRDGSTLWVRDSSRKYHGPDGQALYEGSLEDITERKKAEKALRESEKKYRGLIEGLNDTIYRMTLPDGRYEYFSSSVEKVFGYTSDEFINNPLFIQSIMHPDFAGYFKERWKELLEGNVQEAYEYKIIDSEGNERWIVQSNKAIFDDSGRIKAIEGLCRNVTERKETQLLLEAERSQLRSLFEYSGEAILLLDLENHILDANSGFERIFGYSLEEARGEIIEDLLCPDRFYHTESKELDEESLTGIKDVEIIRKRKDGKEIDVRVSAGPIKIGDNVTGRFVVFDDITERKRAEEALRESEERFRILVNQLPGTAWAVDRDFRFMISQGGGLALLGLKPDQVVGMTLHEFFNTDDSAHIAISSHIMAFTGETVTYEQFHEGLHFRSTLSPIHDDSGAIIGVAGLAIDITEMKLAEKALQDSERRLRMSQKTARIGHVEYNVSTGDILWSEMMYELFERDPALGPPTYEEVMSLHSPEDAAKLERVVTKAITTGAPYALDLKVNLASRRTAIYHAIGTPEREENGKVARITGTVQDVTERIQAEEALRESEKRFRTLFEAAPVSILAARDGKYVLANPASACLLGYNSSQEILGLDALSTIAPEHHEIILKRMTNIGANQENEPIEIPILRPDGGLSWSLSTSVPIELEGKPTALIIGQDISQLKRTEGERERLLSAIEQVAEPIVITDVDGAIQFVNPAFEKVTGYSAEESKGQNPRILKSGKQDNAFYQHLWRTIKSGDTWQGRFINRKKDGSLYTEDATISPMVDESGTITNFVAVKRDISSEIELENRLVQAQKMEAIGTLAGGIAHDFNNILSAIMGFTEMVDADLPEQSQSKEDLGEVIHACRRARDLVKQILTFSRQSEHEPRPLRVSVLVNEALKMIRSSTPTSIEIHQNIQADVPAVIADPTQVHQIMMNLCTNAVQAIEDEHGVISVSLDSVRVSDPREDKEIHPGEYVRLIVSDTGKGIPPENQERIFEPYFTTKKVGEGTGLGLAVVYGIVKETGGSVSVKSEIGKGTTFSVYFPVAEKSDSEPSSNQPDRLPFGKENILFVDDEPPIANLAKKLLERFGYEVSVRHSSLEALELFRDNPQRFDVVVSDMTMPHMTGDELAREILSIRPGISFILCTGYSKRISEVQAKEIGIKAFVMKPLTHHELASTVRRVLDEK